MPYLLRNVVDCLLAGLAAGIVVMVAVVLSDIGGVQGVLARQGPVFPPVWMIAVVAGVVLGGARLTLVLVREEMREDHEDVLRRRFLLPAQRPRRR